MAAPRCERGDRPEAALKHTLCRALSLACRAAGVPPTPREGQRVLLYHSIGAKLPADPYGLSLAPSAFSAQMDRLVALKGCWRPAPFGARAGGAEVSVVFDDGFRDSLTVAAPLLAERNIPFTVFVTAGFVRDASPLHLTRAQLQELAAAPGATIGAHGLEHKRLDVLDDAELGRELLDGRRFLEDVIGRPVDSLSYPHGAVDRRVALAARAAGYRLGGTSRYGLNAPGRDPLLLCRTEIVAFDSLGDFELKLRGHWDWFSRRHRDPAR